MLTRLLRHTPMALHRLSTRTFSAFASPLPVALSSTFVPATNTQLSSRQATLRPQPHTATTRRLQVPYPRATLTSASPAADALGSPESDSRSKDDKDALTPAKMQADVKRFVNAKAVRKLVTSLQDAEAGTGPYGEAGIRPDGVVYRTAIRGLVSAVRPDLAVELYETRIAARRARPSELYIDLPLASSALRSLCRNAKKRNMLREGLAVICNDMVAEADALASLPDDELDALGAVLPRQTVALMTAAAALLGGGDRDKIADKSRALKIVATLRTLCKRLGKRAAAEPSDFNNLIRVLGKTRQLPVVFDVVDAMDAAGVKKDNETFEFLANAALRQVHFVTGAVSMETLPREGLDEVAFVGRSNVGKSSLINMLCNRRALAYVSGRPGKTQQFNYFLVNELDPDNQFFLVDLPGVGYAKVPDAVKDQWLLFMDDEVLMSEMGTINSGFKYVIVLTKMDKMDKQKVKRGVMEKTRETLQFHGCSEEVPIIATSSESKLGRDELWLHLLRALYPEFGHKK